MLKQTVMLFLTILVGLTSGQGSQIPWKTSLTEALKVAAAEKKPILIAFNMDRERANDRMAEDHYRDAAVVAAASKYVCLIASKFRHAEALDDTCPRFGSVTCTDHIKCEMEARKTYLKTVNVDSPQHLNFV